MFHEARDDYKSGIKHLATALDLWLASGVTEDVWKEIQSLNPHRVWCEECGRPDLAEAFVDVTLERVQRDTELQEYEEFITSIHARFTHRNHAERVPELYRYVLVVLEDNKSGDAVEFFTDVWTPRTEFTEIPARVAAAGVWLSAIATTGADNPDLSPVQVADVATACEGLSPIKYVFVTEQFRDEQPATPVEVRQEGLHDERVRLEIPAWETVLE